MQIYAINNVKDISVEKYIIFKVLKIKGRKKILITTVKRVSSRQGWYEQKLKL